MKIYFVRHGESENNAKGLYQDHLPKLSNKGKYQVDALAERLKKINIDKIISSPYMRAMETAEILCERLGKNHEKVDIFRERKRPSVIENKHRNDDNINKILDEIDQNFHNLEWRHSDEENYLDLLKRADEALDYLKQQKEENILVVSHRTFITFLVARMIFGSELNSRIFLTFRLGSRMSNTGITVCEEDSNRWRLTNWNDDAHLG